MRLPEPASAQWRAAHKLTRNWRLQWGCVLCRGHIPGSACVHESPSPYLQRTPTCVAARGDDVGINFVEPESVAGGLGTITRTAGRSGGAKRPVFDQSWRSHAGRAADPEAVTPTSRRRRAAQKGAPSLGLMERNGSVAERRVMSFCTTEPQSYEDDCAAGCTDGNIDSWRENRRMACSLASLMI